jgi:D-sedoheptulose 7-phosphate isomerase
VENNIFLEELVRRYPQLLSIMHEIGNAAECLINCYTKKRKVLVCGNGGSSSDSDHIVGELMKDFEQKRPLDLLPL